MRRQTIKIMSENSDWQRGYIRGAFDALNKVLCLINEYENKVVEKKKIYHDVFDIRPTDLLSDLIENERKIYDKEFEGY